MEFSETYPPNREPNLLNRICRAASSAAPTAPSASSATASLTRILFKHLRFLKHFRNIFPAAGSRCAQSFFHITCPLNMKRVSVFLGALYKVLRELFLAPAFEFGPERILQNRFGVRLCIAIRMKRLF